MQINITKRVKILTVILLGCFGICDLYMRFIASGICTWCYGGLLMQDLLGIPAYTSGVKDELAQYTEIIHINQRELDELSCIKANKWDCSNYLVDSKCKLQILDNPAPLKECIQIYGTCGVEEPYCNHWNYQKCIGLEVYDYIYQRPEVLTKVIDILERPCHYINSALKKLEASKISIKSNSCLMKLSEELGCDGSIKGAEIFILNMYDKDRKIHSKIVIKRKEKTSDKFGN